MNDDTLIDDVLEFWFGELDHAGMPAEDRNKLWFQASESTDSEIRHQFGDAVEAAVAGQLDHWSAGTQGLAALIVLLDQFTRNIYRGTASAFAGDDGALALARGAVASGTDRNMPAIHRVFLYIPFEHAEDLAAQEQGIARFDALLDDCHPDAREAVEGFRRYMVAHRDVVAQFGRFPHRNSILGRASTADEQAHLDKHGGF